MAIIERLRAAPNERRGWLACEILLGLAVLGVGVNCWDLTRTIPLVLLGVIGIASAIVHELHRCLLGTVGLIAVAVLLAVHVLIFPLTGAVSWRISHLVGPICCLVGAVGLWRERPRANERYMVMSDVRGYIAKLAEDLRRIEPETPFHAALGRGFSGQVEQAASWLAGVYDDGAAEFDVTALFVEIERFDINTDQWHMMGFTFEMPVGELFEDLDYNLAEYENMREEVFVLTGVEDLQAAFEQANEADDLFTSEAPEDQRLLEAMGIAFDLITVRMMELLSAAHREAARRGHPVGGVRLFAEVHDSMLFPLCSPPSSLTGPSIPRDL